MTKVPSGPAGSGSGCGEPGTCRPGTPFTDSVLKANVNVANAMASVLTSSASRLTLVMVSQASC